MSDKTFTIRKTVEVTKEEFISELETSVNYWEGRKQREMEKHERQVATLKNKQQAALLEIEKTIFTKKKQIKALLEN